MTSDLASVHVAVMFPPPTTSAEDVDERARAQRDEAVADAGRDRGPAVDDGDAELVAGRERRRRSDLRVRVDPPVDVHVFPAGQVVT